MSAGFILDGVRYEWGALSEILVRDQIKVERWLRGEGREYTDARRGRTCWRWPPR